MPEGAPRGPVEELFTAPVLKLLARHEEHAPRDFWRLAEEATQGRLEITWSSSTSLLEISGAGVTKATTLARLCEDLGIAPADVVAFGDMPNDVALLTWAGTAVAVENADADVHAVADLTAGHHDEDGVAHALAGMFGL